VNLEDSCAREGSVGSLVDNRECWCGEDCGLHNWMERSSFVSWRCCTMNDDKLISYTSSALLWDTVVRLHKIRTLSATYWST